jgi:hypothetical protein
MSDAEQPDSAPTAAERRLGEHLQLLRTAAPDPGRALVPRIVRTARWQRLVREPVRVAGMIAGAALDGLLALVAPGRRGNR